MRECGSCTFCCSVLFVPELRKQRNKHCKHCDEGCSIYNSRPESCVDFKCGWLQGDMDESNRPDKVRFVIEKIEGESLVLVLFDKDCEITEESTKMLSFYKDNNISVVANNGLALMADGVKANDIRKSINDYAKKIGMI